MVKIYKSIFSVIMSVVCALFNLVPMFSAGQPSEIPEGAERYSYGEKAREVMDIYMPERYLCDCKINRTFDITIMSTCRITIY